MVDVSIHKATVVAEGGGESASIRQRLLREVARCLRALKCQALVSDCVQTWLPKVLLQALAVRHHHEFAGIRGFDQVGLALAMLHAVKDGSYVEGLVLDVHPLVHVV